MRNEILLEAGLEEEVLKSLKNEKKIKILTKKLEEMFEKNYTYEQMSRIIVNNLLKDKNYE